MAVQLAGAVVVEIDVELVVEVVEDEEAKAELLAGRTTIARMTSRATINDVLEELVAGAVYTQEQAL